MATNTAFVVPDASRQKEPVRLANTALRHDCLESLPGCTVVQGSTRAVESHVRLVRLEAWTPGEYLSVTEPRADVFAEELTNRDYDIL